MLFRVCHKGSWGGKDSPPGWGDEAKLKEGTFLTGKGYRGDITFGKYGNEIISLL